MPRRPTLRDSVSQRIQQMSKEVLQVNQGSLYPALHGLEHRGWIPAEWGTSEDNRKSNFYDLTKKGLAQLKAEEDQRKPRRRE